MSRAWSWYGAVVVAGAACGSAGDVAPPPGGDALSAVSLTRPLDAIFDVLARIDGPGDQGAFAPSYVEVSCGQLHHYDPSAAVAARRGHQRVLDWTVRLSNDGHMAWAIGAADTGVELLVLEPGGGGAWQLVAGALSNLDGAGCDAVAPSDPMPAAPLAPPVERAPIAADAMVVVCGRWPDRPDDDDARQLRDIETAGDPSATPDLVGTGVEIARASDGDQMTWSVGRSSTSGATRFRTLAIRERRVSGWAVAALVWTPDVSGGGRPCVPAPKVRGRVIVTDTTTEILDYVHFPANSAAISPDSLPILGAIAATFNGNPGIELVGIVAHADPGEPDPLSLAEQRGLAVRSYLTAKGVAVDRFVVEFVGEGPAIAGKLPATPVDEYNRSVEFEILKRGPD